MWICLIVGYFLLMIIILFFNVMFLVVEIKISIFVEMVNKKDLMEEVIIFILSIVDGFDMKFLEVEYKLIFLVLLVCRKVIFINNLVKDYLE